MKEKFGDKALEKFNAKAPTDALRNVYMELASQDPKQFVALFAEQSQSPTGVDQGSMNTTIPSGAGGGNKVEWSREWVKDVRKNEPNRYWSADFQYQLQDRVIKNPSLYGFDR
jgi:hypothetical protein